MSNLQTRACVHFPTSNPHASKADHAAEEGMYKSFPPHSTTSPTHHSRQVMFFGHPVERLCTYQYSLASLIPGLLFALEDCGAPELAARAPSLTRATEFKSSDRQSLLKFMGLPLDLFGKVCVLYLVPYCKAVQNSDLPTRLVGIGHG